MNDGESKARTIIPYIRLNPNYSDANGLIGITCRTIFTRINVKGNREINDLTFRHVLILEITSIRLKNY